MYAEITVWDIFQVLRRRWYLLLFAVLACVGLAAAVSAVLKPKYRSESLLLIRLGRENLGVDATAALAEKAGVNMVDTRKTKSTR